MTWMITADVAFFALSPEGSFHACFHYTVRSHLGRA
jgi:hypothetical protein